MTTQPNTRVRSYDWTAAADLPELARLAAALDDFAHAARRARLMTQDDFLALVRDLATGLAYADMCSSCNVVEVAYPHAAEVTDRWLRGTYRCHECGATWQCGYAVDAPDLLDPQEGQTR